VKRKSLSLFVLVFFCLAAIAAADSVDTKSVDPTQVLAWLTAGISNSRLIRLVHERGINFVPTESEIRTLESAGADEKLVLALKRVKSGIVRDARPSIQPALEQASVDAHGRRYHEAELQLRTALRSDSQNAAIHFALAAMLRQQEQWDDAFDELTLSTQLMPDFPENHSSFAYIFYRLDDGPNAIAEARTALSMDPQNAETYQYLGLGLYSNGQYSAAVHAFAESLVRDADNPDTYYDMGIALQADGNLTSAAAAYRYAIHLRPDFWEAHSNLGLVLHHDRRFEEAIAEYLQAKRSAPEEASIRNNLGNTYCDKGDFDAAIAELSELYRQHPEWEHGHTCLAQAYMAKRNYRSAVQQWQLAVREKPNGSTEHRMLGQALLMDGQPEEALREFRLSVTLDPDSDAAHHFLGTALFEGQQLQAAEKEFREAVRLNATPDNHYSLAACLMSMDRYEEALSELEIASRLDPEKPLYRARRDELLKLMRGTNSSR